MRDPLSYSVSVVEVRILGVFPGLVYISSFSIADGFSVELIIIIIIIMSTTTTTTTVIASSMCVSAGSDARRGSPNELGLDAFVRPRQKQLVVVVRTSREACTDTTAGRHIHTEIQT